MTTPLFPFNESERLEALASYNLLDTLPEEDFDNITFLASVICQTPFSLISLVDKDRQFFKSRLGLSATETSRDLSFCAHAINQPQIIFEVEDARLDERFHDNALVTGKPNIAFYAGIPLVDTDGFALGTLCVIDEKPRKLSDEQKEALTKLSKQVMSLIEARKKRLLEEKLKLLDYTLSNASIPIYYLLEDATIYDFNDVGCKNLGYTRDEFYSFKMYDFDKDYNEYRWAKLWTEIRKRGKVTSETKQQKKDGTLIDVLITYSLVKYGNLELNCCYVMDITEVKKQEEKKLLIDFSFRHSTTPINILRKNGSVFDFNDAAHQLLGYTKEEYQSISIPDIDPDYHNGIWPVHWEELKKAKSLSFETTLRKNNGDIINANIEANFIQYRDQEYNCVYFTDITEKKKVEDQLKLSAFTIDNATWGIVYFKEDGSIYNCNLAFAKIYGYTSLEEVKTKKAFDFGTNFTTESWKQYWDNLREKERLQFVAKRIKNDGTIIDVEIHPNMIQFGDIELNCVYVFDVTEKLAKEKQLKVVDFAYTHDITAKHFLRKDGTIYDFNNAAARLFGYTMEEYKNISLFDLSLRHNPESWEERFESFKTVSSEPYVTILKRKDNEYRFIEHISQIMVYEDLELCYTSMVDVTEKKRLEERLELVNYSFKQSTIATLFLAEDGHIIDYNLAYLNDYGFSEDELSKYKIYELHGGFDPQSWRQYWINLRESGGQTFESKRKTKDGFFRDVEINSQILQYGDKEIICVYVKDLSDRKLLDKNLKIIDFSFRNATIPMHYTYKDGTVYDFNEAACNLLGYTPREYKKLNIIELSTKHTIDTWGKRFDKLKNGPNKPYLTTLIRKDKSLVYVEIRTEIIQHEEMELAFSSIIDVTERMKLQQELDNQRLFYEDILNSIPCEIAVLSEDFRYRFINPAALSNPETRRWIIGKTDREYITHKKGGNGVVIEDRMKVYQEAINENKIITWEEELKNRLGELVYVSRNIYPVLDDDRKVKMIIGYAYDTTTIHIANAKAKLFELGFRNIQTPSIIVDINNGRMYDFNEAALNVLGYLTDEFKEINIRDLDILIGNEEQIKLNNQISEIKSLTRYTSFKKKDNTLILVECKLQYLFFEGKELNYVFFTDITQKQKAEEELNQSNQRYEYATLATSDVIWEADLLKNEGFISKNFTSLFGHEVADEWMPLENNIWTQNVHPDDIDLVLKGRNKELSSNTRYNRWIVEYRLRKADGSYASVRDRTFAIIDERGKIIRMIGAMQDITKQKVEEERLRLMESVIVNTNDAVLITEAEPINEPGPRIVFANEAFTKMTGYSQEELIGKTPRIFQNEETDREELDKFRDALEKWEPSEVTLLNSKKNGEKYWVNIRTTPIANENGWFTHWISIERDVTKEIEAAKEKELLLQEVIKNNKELTQFTYIATHNLRAPLTNLMSICNLLKTDKIEDARTLKLIEGFKISTSYLSETLHDLIKVLIIKENPSWDKEAVDFKAIFHKVQASVNMKLLEMAAIIKDDFTEAPLVLFNNAYMESIILNLITNSLRYAHPKRRPHITIKTTKEPTGATKLVYTDNGIGMNMKRVKDKIFGLYQRFHSNSDGKGMGLYLIHSQVTSLGGTIEVDSEEGVGTTFIITFKQYK